jgi:hypothetical protein
MIGSVTWSFDLSRNQGRQESERSRRRAKGGSQTAVETIMSVYFEYQGKVPPDEYHYIVEVSKKDANGGGRSPDELRLAASIVLISGLSVPLDGVLTPVKIEKFRFDEVVKEEIFQATDGAIYKVTQEPTA